MGIIIGDLPFLWLENIEKGGEQRTVIGEWRIVIREWQYVIGKRKPLFYGPITHVLIIEKGVWYGILKPKYITYSMYIWLVMYKDYSTPTRKISSFI